MALSQSDFEKAAADLCCEVSAIRAVDEVESRGEGFHSTGEPKILFERHIFFREVVKKRGRGQAQVWANYHPGICNGDPGGYLGGYAEHRRLQQAVSLDRECALLSASWGRYQIMGFNWEVCGYGSLQDFINAMYTSEEKHLEAFVGFVKSQGLAKYLKSHDWAAFAKRYNGPAYAKNQYDIRLAEAYEKYSQA